MNEMSIPVGAVVVGVDGSPQATSAASWAYRLAQDEGRPLVVLHAIGDPRAERQIGLVAEGPDRDQVVRAVKATGKDLVRVELERLREASLRDQRQDRREEVLLLPCVAVGDPRGALLEADRRGASAVVVGSRGRGPLLTLLLGSVSAMVARYAHCPVVVVRPHDAGRVRHGVVVGSDGTAGSNAVVEHAFRLAAERRLPLTVLGVWWDAAEAIGRSYAALPAEIPEEFRVAVSESMVGLREKYPEVLVHVDHMSGPPVSRLVAESRRSDLLVLGRRRRATLGQFLHASVSVPVLEHAACPVMIVPLNGELSS